MRQLWFKLSRDSARANRSLYLRLGVSLTVQSVRCLAILDGRVPRLPFSLSPKLPRLPSSVSVKLPPASRSATRQIRLAAAAPSQGGLPQWHTSAGGPLSAPLLHGERKLQRLLLPALNHLLPQLPLVL